jgi:hypothetical protein
MNKQIPVYEVIVDYDDEQTRMIRNSFVESPAVEISRFAFNKANSKLVFSENKSEQMFMSVSILADTPILRIDEKGNPFYVVFTKDNIRKIFNKFVMEGRNHEVTLYHNNSKDIDGTYMVESFMIEKGRVESPLFDVPDGSLITTYWVKDKDKYEELLNDEKFNGFSIEIDSKLEQIAYAKYNTVDDSELINAIKTILYSTDTDENKENKIKELLNL